MQTPAKEAAVDAGKVTLCVTIVQGATLHSSSSEVFSIMVAFHGNQQIAHAVPLPALDDCVDDPTK